METVKLKSNDLAVIQDQFIQDLIDEKLLVSVYLKSGLQLKGVVTQSDENTFLLTSHSGAQMIFKHAVATICPLAAHNKNA